MTETIAVWKTLVLLVSQSCCNKLSQMYWLKTTQTYSHTVLGVRSLKSVLMG